MSFDLDVSFDDFEISFCAIANIFLYVLNYTPMLLLAIVSVLIAMSPQRTNWQLILMLAYTILSEASSLFTHRIMWAQCKIDIAAATPPGPTCKAYMMSLPHIIVYKISASVILSIAAFLFAWYSDEGKYKFHGEGVEGPGVEVGNQGTVQVQC